MCGTRIATESRFRVYLSLFVVITAALSAMLILADPDVLIDMGRVKIHFKGDTFSPDTKGGIIAAILIAGWQAVTAYWFPQQRKSQEIQNGQTTQPGDSPH